MGPTFLRIRRTLWFLVEVQPEEVSVLCGREGALRALGPEPSSEEDFAAARGFMQGVAALGFLVLQKHLCSEPWKHAVTGNVCGQRRVLTRCWDLNFGFALAGPC